MEAVVDLAADSDEDDETRQLGIAVARTASFVLKPAAAGILVLRFLPRKVLRRFSKTLVVLAWPPTVPAPSILAGPLAGRALPPCVMLEIRLATWWKIQC